MCTKYLVSCFCKRVRLIVSLYIIFISSPIFYSPCIDFPIQSSGPVLCVLLGVSSNYAQPITGQVTEVTCTVIGRAQPELTPSKRQKTGPDPIHHCFEWYLETLTNFSHISASYVASLRQVASLHLIWFILVWSQSLIVTPLNGNMSVFENMTSSNESIFRVAGLFCGEFTGNRCSVWSWLVITQPYAKVTAKHLLGRGKPHDDAIKWKQFARYWPFVRRIHRSPVNSPHKALWRGALMFSFICAWTNRWVNNREAGDLRSQQALYVISVMRTRHSSTINMAPIYITVASIS